MFDLISCESWQRESLTSFAIDVSRLKKKNYSNEETIHKMETDKFP